MHQVAAWAARPTASMFKLFVLGALAHQIAAGRVSWNQELTVTAALKSAGSGTLRDAPDGTRLPVRQAAVQMISISDNTAADMLIHLAGRAAVQAQDRQWSGYAALNVPFLTTRELFLLKVDWPGLAGPVPAPGPGPARGVPCHRGGPAGVRVSPAQLRRQPLVTPGPPADIQTLEWFASPDDLCRVFAGLRQLAAQPALAPLGPIMSANDGLLASGLTRRSGPRSGTRAAPSKGC